MSFSVFLFGADPEKLRDTLAADETLAAEIAARASHYGIWAEQIETLDERMNAIRSLNWPAPGDMLSVNAFLCLLDYAAERINVARLQDVRYSSLVDDVPLLPEMTARPGPLALPDVSGLECEIGYLGPDELREMAERGAPPCADRDLDAGTELVEIFESLADDGLGLYTIIDGAKLTRGQAPRAAAQGPSMAELRGLITAAIGGLEDDEPVLRDIDRQLLDAAEEGELDKVRSLLEQGADVNVARGDGYTPFLLALGEGHNDVCHRLLDAGARIDAVTKIASSAMHIAAGDGNLEGLELLHRLGLSLESRDRYGSTPLMDAIECHEVEAAEWLLEHGADVNASNKDGWTSLHNAYATSLDYEEDGIPSPLIALLEKYGADPTIKDDQGRTPKDFPVR